MILRSSLKKTTCHISDSALLGRDSNRNPGCYLGYSIHIYNNFTGNSSNINNNMDDTTDLRDVFLPNVSRCGSKHCLFPKEFIHVNNVLSTRPDNCINLYYCSTWISVC